MLENWYSTSTISSAKFKCGYCGNIVAPNLGYRTTDEFHYVYICPYCNKPSYLNLENNNQYPAPSYGNEVQHLPEEVEKLYKEARDCFSVNAYTSSVLTCRKLLMHIAVEKGAQEGESFLSYVNYLSDKNYIPPDGKAWVELIRKKGNEANHQIVIMEQEDAHDLIDFVEMLLRFVYEFPAIVANRFKKP